VASSSCSTGLAVEKSTGVAPMDSASLRRSGCWSTTKTLAGALDEGAVRGHQPDRPAAEDGDAVARLHPRQDP